MFFKLTKVSAYHSGLKLYETLSFFNFFAGGAQRLRRFMYSLLLNSLDAHSQLAYYPSG
jgi:hypothetical protein